MRSELFWAAGRSVAKSAFWDHPATQIFNVGINTCCCCRAKIHSFSRVTLHLTCHIHIRRSHNPPSSALLPYHSLILWFLLENHWTSAVLRRWKEGWHVPPLPRLVGPHRRHQFRQRRCPPSPQAEYPSQLVPRERREVVAFLLGPAIDPNILPWHS